MLVQFLPEETQFSQHSHSSYWPLPLWITWRRKWPHRGAWYKSHSNAVARPVESGDGEPDWEECAYCRWGGWYKNYTGVCGERTGKGRCRCGKEKRSSGREHSIQYLRGSRKSTLFGCWHVIADPELTQDRTRTSRKRVNCHRTWQMKADIWQQRQLVTYGFVTRGKQRKIYKQSTSAIVDLGQGYRRAWQTRSCSDTFVTYTPNRDRDRSCFRGVQVPKPDHTVELRHSEIDFQHYLGILNILWGSPNHWILLSSSLLIRPTITRWFIRCKPTIERYLDYPILSQDTFSFKKCR